MKQAKVLTVAERKRRLVVTANDRHSERNRLAVMLSFLAGLRVGEVSRTTFGITPPRPRPGAEASSRP
jgi:integrase/recombinase XerD